MPKVQKTDYHRFFVGANHLGMCLLSVMFRLSVCIIPDNTALMVHAGTVRPVATTYPVIHIDLSHWALDPLKSFRVTLPRWSIDAISFNAKLCYSLTDLHRFEQLSRAVRKTGSKIP